MLYYPSIGYFDDIFPLALCFALLLFPFLTYWLSTFSDFPLWVSLNSISWHQTPKIVSVSFEQLTLCGFQFNFMFSHKGLSTVVYMVFKGCGITPLWGAALTCNTFQHFLNTPLKCCRCICQVKGNPSEFIKSPQCAKGCETSGFLTDKPLLVHSSLI